MKHMTRQEYIAYLRRYCLMHANYFIALHAWKIAQHGRTSICWLTITSMIVQLQEQQWLFSWCIKISRCNQVILLFTSCKFVANLNTPFFFTICFWLISRTIYKLLYFNDEIVKFISIDDFSQASSAWEMASKDRESRRQQGSLPRHLQ